MNSGTLKGYPEQPESGEFLVANENGNIILSGSASISGGSSSIATTLKWEN